MLVLGMVLVTLSLWIAGGMSVYGYLPLLFSGGVGTWLGLRSKRERATIERQLAAARSIGQLPPARVIE